MENEWRNNMSWNGLWKNNWKVEIEYVLSASKFVRASQTNRSFVLCGGRGCWFFDDDDDSPPFLPLVVVVANAVVVVADTAHVATAAGNGVWFSNWT